MPELQDSKPSETVAVNDSSSSPAPVDRHPGDGSPVQPAERSPRNERSADEQDIGWGDGPAGYDDDWYLAERPPHHG